MENKKKMAFNVVFLILVFAGTIYGVFHGEDLGEGEEARLHHHVDAAAEAQVLGDVHGVQGVELRLLLPDAALELRRQLVLQLLRAPGWRTVLAGSGHP